MDGARAILSVEFVGLLRLPVPTVKHLAELLLDEWNALPAWSKAQFLPEYRAAMQRLTSQYAYQYTLHRDHRN